jgi:CDP-glycerol glycerophosphotransferase (TagB/SpsB family)
MDKKEIIIKHSLKKVVSTFFNCGLFFIFSLIIPKNKNLYLYGGIRNLYGGNSSYLFEEHIKLNKGKLYFCISKKSKFLKKKFKKNYSTIGSLKNFFLILRARYIFIEDGHLDINIVPLIGNFNIVNLWHGTPIKKISIDDSKSKISDKPISLLDKLNKLAILMKFKNYKFFSSPNKFTKKHFESAFLTKNVKVLGYPRNDYFFKNTKEIEDNILKEIGIFKSKKIFLYGPTWRDHNLNIKPFSNDFLKKLNIFLKNKNYHLLIQKHPNTKKILLEKFSNIIDISGKYEIQKILKLSDVYIGDYSSIYFDFGIQEKIMISYLYDLKEYNKKSRDFYFKIEEEIPSFKSYDENQLLKFIKNIKNLEKDKNYKKNIKLFNKKFNTVEDGNSSKRILKYLKIS